MIVDGARLAQSPLPKSHQRPRWQKGGSSSNVMAASSKGKGGRKGAKGKEEEEDGVVTEDPFPPAIGSYIAIDTKRSVSDPLPDIYTSIATTICPPATSNIGQVTSVHGEGPLCDATLVCTCVQPPQPAPPKEEKKGGKGRGKAVAAAAALRLAPTAAANVVLVRALPPSRPHSARSYAAAARMQTCRIHYRRYDAMRATN